MRLQLKWTVMLFFAALQLSFAQEKSISGTVADESGIPLPGVTILVKGSTKGTQTDFDGNYKISVQEGKTLVFSYVGMKSEEKKVGKSSVINVKLKTDAQELDDVVVVGYAKVNKDDYVGTATEISVESLKGKSVSTVSQALNGEAAGVRVINTSGQPGSEAKIRIRGFGSLVEGARNPLYVLDGVPFDGNVSSINPDDIENMVILKDATATAVYGSRGANGVILITTKKGKAGHSKIQLETKTGFNMQLLPQYSVIKNPEDYIGLSWEAMYNQGKFNGEADPVAYANSTLFSDDGIKPKYNMWEGSVTDLIDPTTHKVKTGVKRKYTPENWRDYAFQTSLRTEANLNISGGEGKTSYYTSVGYLKDIGYSIKSEYERYTTRLNISHQAKPWLKGNINTGYTYSNTQNNGQTDDSGSVFWFVNNIPSIYPLFLRNNKGEKIKDIHYGGYEYDYGEGRGFAGLTNAIADAYFNTKNKERHELNTNLSLTVDILKGLTFETRFGVQYYNENFNVYSNPYYGGAKGINGSLYKEKEELFSYKFLQLLRYDTKIKKHGLQVFVAHESTKWNRSTLDGDKNGLIMPDGKEFNNAINTGTISSYIEDYALEGYLGQIMYDYDNKYLFSASIRRDGSSRFLKDKWGTFASVGLGWLVSRENFLKNNEFIRQLKLKTSYGTVGDQAGVGYYPGYNIYKVDNFMGLGATAFDKIGYPNLTWEISKIFQVGIETSLFSSKALDISIDYYRKVTDNLIFDTRLAPSTGNAILKVNDGLLVNQGIEFNVVGHIVNKPNFYIDLSVNGEILRNKLEKMPLDVSTGKDKIIDLAETNFGRVKGRSIYDYYMREYKGVNPDTGAALWSVSYIDKNNNKTFDSGEEIESLYEFKSLNPNADILESVTEKYDEATQKFLDKSAIPDIRGAFSLSAGYHGWSLSAQFLYSIGGYGYDYAYASLMGNGQIGNANWSIDIYDRWQKPGDVTDVPRLTSNRSGDTKYASTSSRFLVKSDYLALNNIRLGYELPSKFLEDKFIKGLAFSLTGDNLWLKTQRVGFNPTTSETGETSRYTYSPLSTVTLGVKVNF